MAAGRAGLDTAWRSLEFVRDGDQEGLEDYIRDEIADSYCDLPEDDGDVEDSTTDDNDATGDGIDYGRGSDPSDIAARLMDDLEEEAHELICDQQEDAQGWVWFS